MPSPTAPRVDAGLAGALRDAVGRMGRRMRAERAATDLSLGQLAALRTLERHGPMTASELAAHEKVQPPSMTKIVARLEELGYVSRAPHAADKRQVVVTISADGISLLDDDRRRRDAWIAQRLRGLTGDEVAALRKALPVLEKLSHA